MRQMNSDVPAEFIDLLTAHQTRLQSYIASLLADHEATWDRDSRVDALESCLKTLTSSNRDLVRARYSHGESLAEISTRTSRSTNSIKQAFFRIRKSLSECIEQRLDVV